jgi:hypothetical protein
MWPFFLSIAPQFSLFPSTNWILISRYKRRVVSLLLLTVKSMLRITSRHGVKTALSRALIRNYAASANNGAAQVRGYKEPLY